MFGPLGPGCSARCPAYTNPGKRHFDRPAQDIRSEHPIVRSRRRWRARPRLRSVWLRECIRRYILRRHTLGRNSRRCRSTGRAHCTPGSSCCRHSAASPGRTRRCTLHSDTRSSTEPECSTLRLRRRSRARRYDTGGYPACMNRRMHRRGTRIRSVAPRSADRRDRSSTYCRRTAACHRHIRRHSLRACTRCGRSRASPNCPCRHSAVASRRCSAARRVRSFLHTLRRDMRMGKRVRIAAGPRHRSARRCCRGTTTRRPCTSSQRPRRRRRPHHVRRRFVPRPSGHRWADTTRDHSCGNDRERTRNPPDSLSHRDTHWTRREGRRARGSCRNTKRRHHSRDRRCTQGCRAEIRTTRPRCIGRPRSNRGAWAASRRRSTPHRTRTELTSWRRAMPAQRSCVST